MRSPAAADGYVKPLSAADVEKIYFVDNDAILAEVLAAAKNNLLKVSSGTAISSDMSLTDLDNTSDAPISVNVVFKTNGTVTLVVALPIDKYVLREISVPKEAPSVYKSWTAAENIKFEVTDSARSG